MFRYCPVFLELMGFRSFLFHVMVLLMTQFPCQSCVFLRFTSDIHSMQLRTSQRNNINANKTMITQRIVRQCFLVKLNKPHHPHLKEQTCPKLLSLECGQQKEKIGTSHSLCDIGHPTFWMSNLWSWQSCQLDPLLSDAVGYLQNEADVVPFVPLAHNAQI